MSWEMWTFVVAPGAAVLLADWMIRARYFWLTRKAAEPRADEGGEDG